MKLFRIALLVAQLVTVMVISHETESCVKKNKTCTSQSEDHGGSSCGG